MRTKFNRDALAIFLSIIVLLVAIIGSYFGIRLYLEKQSVKITNNTNQINNASTTTEVTSSPSETNLNLNDYLKDYKNYVESSKIGVDISTIHFSQKEPFSQKFPDTNNQHLIYLVDEKNVYYDGWGEGFQRIEKADPATFRVLEGTTVAKDKNYVYSDGKIVKDADPNTYTIIDGVYHNGFRGGIAHNVYLGKDTANVYFGIYKLNDANLSTVHIYRSTKNIFVKGGIGKNEVILDDKSVFDCNFLGAYGGGCQKFPNSDAKTFQFLYSGGFWAKDKNNVYTGFGDGIASGVDSASLQSLGDCGFDKDKNNICFDGAQIYNSDAKPPFNINDKEHFEVLPNCFSKDSHNVYAIIYAEPGCEICNTAILLPVSELDPNTTKVLNDIYLADKSSVFYSNYYSVDYYGIFKIDGADPSTFKVVTGKDWDAEDSHAKYKYGKIYISI